MQHDPEDLAGAGRLIAHFLNRLPDGFRFLLREDAGRGYMCNLMGPKNGVPVVHLRTGQPVQYDDDTLRFPAYALTAAAAVTASAERIPQDLWIGDRDGLG